MFSRTHSQILRNSASTGVLIAVLMTPSLALAGGGNLPNNGRYIAGSGKLVYSGNGLVIDQNSTRGIIDWQSFSIGQGNSVFFNNGSGATLNEVTGNNLSQIAGSLKATGSVYLVNPSGVIVTPTGQVFTQGSFVASTRGVNNSAFMAGSGLSFSGTSSGNVVNEGSVSSGKGDVVLFGNNARTAAGSTTSAANGTVAVLAGDSIYYRPGDNSRILVKGGTGDATNHGTIKAAQAELAAAGGNVYAMAGTNQGVIQATGTANVNGHVWLIAGKTTYVAGSTSAKNANGSGGTIIATGKSVNVSGQAKLSASGTTGGTVLIGGDEHGGSNRAEKLVAGYIPDADITTVASGAQISADGSAGAGGNVVVWSNKKTAYKGTITAHGSKGGAGGNAEVSSHEVLAFKGKVDLTAWGSGATGNLLLDPSNVVISTGSNQGEQEQYGVGQITFKPVAYSSVIDVGTLESALSSANVTVSTQSNYNDAGDISIMTQINWGAHTLTLDAYHSIFFDAPLAATGSAGLVIKTNDGGVGGDFFFNGGNITFANLSQSLTINGQVYTLVDSVSGLASAVSNNPSNHIALANSYDASADGAYGTVPVSTNFSGIFEGLGNTISNLTIDDTSDTDVGLFASIQAATIRDLTLVSPQVTGDVAASYVGALVGYSSAGELLNDTVTGTSSSPADITDRASPPLQYLGGLVGVAQGGTIDNSAVEGTALINALPHAASQIFVGGLAGNISGSATVENSSSDAILTANSPLNADVGGLIGYSRDSTVSSSFASGFLQSAVASNCDPGPCDDLSNVGGLIGKMYGGSVENSYAAGNVNSSGGNGAAYSTATGGLIGYVGPDEGSGGTVTDSYATGNVSINASAPLGGYGGGLVGWADTGSAITASYAQGLITGNGSEVGGLVGLNGGTISNSWAQQSGSGTVVGSQLEASDVGGLVGENTEFGTINQSFGAQQEQSDSYAIVGGYGSMVGGLVGFNSGTIENSYSNPTYSFVCPNCLPLIYSPIPSPGDEADVGGLVGREDSAKAAQIISSYSTGSVGGGSSLGGLIGYDVGLNNDQKQNVYWDTDTSGTSCAAGNSGCSSDAGITGETTSQLISGLPGGFDSPPWYEISGVNDGLPCLASVTGGCGD